MIVITERPRRPGRGTLLALGLVLVTLALPVRWSLVAPGPPLDEGIALVYPERLLEGDIPNRDHEHFYGPANVWVVAGVFAATEPSLTAERAVGLAYRVAVVVALFALAWRWGPLTAGGTGMLAALLIVPTGLTAWAWLGGLAAALGAVWALWLVVSFRRSPEGTTDPPDPLAGAVAGVLGGVALLFRPDLAPAVLLAGGALIGLTVRRVRIVAVAALAATTAAGYAVHAVLAGPGAAWRGLVVDPLVHVRAGRRLPLPSPGSLDSYLDRAGFGAVPDSPLGLSSAAQLTVFFWLTVAGAVAALTVGVVAVRRRRDDRWARLSLALGLFAVGILPQVVQRPDSTHVLFVAAVSVPLGVAAVASAWCARPLAVAGTFVAACAVVAATVPTFTVRPVVDAVGRGGGARSADAHIVDHAGRRFSVDSAGVEADLEAVLADVDRLTAPGDLLFVGPRDLTRTNYGDTFLYHLLPHLEPATYFLEINPGTANRRGSRLAADLRRADVLVLTDRYDGWSEPNDSGRPGPREPLDVVERQFCARRTHGPWTVFVRCRS